MTIKRLGWLLVGLVCLSVGLTRAADQPREKIKTIRNYVVYYGQGQLDKLAQFGLAIVQPGTLTDDELQKLHDKGTLVVAYLSIGEVDPQSEWYLDGRVNPKWLLGKNEIWGSYYMDARQKGWQDLMVSLMGTYLKRGFDGIFMDTVDTAENFPQTQQGMIDLINGLRKTYPDALLVQNRGFAVAEQTAAQIDALMFEDLTTSYDFDKKNYIDADNSADADQMADLSKRTGLPILALDYASPDNPQMARQAVEAARKYGFIPSVSVIDLDSIPDYGLDAELFEATPAVEVTAQSP